MRSLTFILLAAGPAGILAGNWIDPDTHKGDYTTVSALADGNRNDGTEYSLVFSDEFNVDGRTFNDGHDPRWTALHKNDYTNNALQ